MARFSLGEEEDDGNPGGTKRSAQFQEEEEEEEGVVAEEWGDWSNSEEGKKKKRGRRQGEHEEVGEGNEEEEQKQLGEVRGESSSSDGGCISVRIDPDILDCSICYEPLRSPIFQCQNGHVACSSCRSKLLNKCHLCSHVISYSRCLLLEKVIESIRLSCSYAKYGCKKAISYADRDSHEGSCIYAPCFCPISTCGFCGSREMLADHFISKHVPDERFCYDQSFKIVFEQTDPFRTLYSEDGHLFLLLNNCVENLGHAFSIICLRPSSLNWDFLYELTTDKYLSDRHGSSLHLKSFTANITEWKGVYPKNVFLLVPSDCCTSFGKIILDVCIHKISAN